MSDNLVKALAAISTKYNEADLLRGARTVIEKHEVQRPQPPNR